MMELGSNFKPKLYAMEVVKSKSILLLVVLLLVHQTIKCQAVADKSKQQLSKISIQNGTTAMPGQVNQAHQMPATVVVTHITAQTNKTHNQTNISATSSSTNLQNQTTTTTTAPKTKGSENKTVFGEESSASLFRPSIVRNLFKFRANKNKGHSSGDDDHEVVTKTIMVPLAGESDEEPENEDGFVVGKKLRGREKDSHQPEASLRLTSTEMNKLLSDGEGPELYREREIHGEGVTLAEEPAVVPKYSTSASFGSAQHSSLYGAPGLSPSMMQSSSSLGGHFGGYAENYSPFHQMQQQQQQHYQQQLSQAGSEMGGDGGDSMGFNHRFGTQFNQEDPSFYQAGRLMQSPNEFNEMHAGHGELLGHTAGLPRAASEYSGAGEAVEMGLYGTSQQQQPQHMPALDRHASELYGSGLAQMGSSSPFQQQFGADSMFNHQAANFDARLSQAGSHPGSHSEPHLSDMFASRYGNPSPPVLMMSHQQQFAPNLDAAQRSFAAASQQYESGQNIMSGGSSVSFSSAPDGGRLKPLSPIVPVAEEVAPSSQHQDNLDPFPDQQRRGSQLQQARQRPEIHESASDDESPEQQQTKYTSGEDDSMGDQSDQSDDRFNDETTLASVHESEMKQQQRQQEEERHNLVLNLPPPVAPETQFVEFYRAGAAGYYGPTAVPRQKLAHRSAAAAAAAAARLDRQQAEAASKGLISAHAGKYIID